MADHYLALDSGNVTQQIDGIDTVEPAFHIPAKWISEDKRIMVISRKDRQLSVEGSLIGSNRLFGRLFVASRLQFGYCIDSELCDTLTLGCITFYSDKLIGINNERLTEGIATTIFHLKAHVTSRR